MAVFKRSSLLLGACVISYLTCLSGSIATLSLERDRTFWSRGQYMSRGHCTFLDELEQSHPGPKFYERPGYEFTVRKVSLDGQVETAGCIYGKFSKDDYRWISTNRSDMLNITCFMRKSYVDPNKKTSYRIRILMFVREENVRKLECSFKLPDNFLPAGYRRISIATLHYNETIAYSDNSTLPPVSQIVTLPSALPTSRGETSGQSLVSNNQWMIAAAVLATLLLFSCVGLTIYIWKNAKKKKRERHRQAKSMVKGVVPTYNFQ